MKLRHTKNCAIFIGPPCICPMFILRQTTRRSAVTGKSTLGICVHPVDASDIGHFVKETDSSCGYAEVLP